MANNPLQQFFRQPSVILKLPTLGRWYTPNDVSVDVNSEVPIYGLSALDDIMLNTPDAMLNGQALEKVICNCVPAIHNVKHLLIPDLEAIFLGIKMATNNGKYDIERKCPKCNHENTFEVNCATILDTMSFITDSDTEVLFDKKLKVKIKPYSFEMRHLFMQHQFEHEKVLRVLDDDKNEVADTYSKAEAVAESIKRLSLTTLEILSKVIESITILDASNTVVTDQEQIYEWVLNIPKAQADNIIDAVTRINKIGPDKTVNAKCTECGHEWDETLNFDPASFFMQR